MKEPDIVDDLERMWVELSGGSAHYNSTHHIAAVMAIASETIRELRDELDEKTASAPPKLPDTLSEAERLAAIRDARIRYEGDTTELSIALWRLRRKCKIIQHDLDEAVGYRLATAEETRGDQDRDRDC